MAQNKKMFEDQKFILRSEDDVLQSLLSQNGAIVFCWEDSNVDMKCENVFYVFNDNDDAKEYDEFVKRGARVISSGFVYESIEKNMPVPIKDHPLYSSCLKDVNVVLDSSLDELVRERMGKYIRYMSGHIVSKVNGETSVLVGAATGSLEYKVSLESGVDIVTPEWIDQCWEQKKYLETTQFKMKPFCGCLIAVTGLASPTRLAIKSLVETYGGSYTPDLTRSCTHLLAKEPEGLKYHYAIQWGIHCVSPDWFFDSINDECCKDERLYLLPIVSRRPMFSARSRGDLGRMSPKLRSNHVSQIKRTGSTKTRGRSGPMNFVFINSDKKKILPSQLLKSHMSLTQSRKSNQNPKYQSISTTSTTITKDEVTKLIELCDETIQYYTDLANQNDISEKLSQLQSKQD